ncbi:MAG: phosphatidylglycerophosphatase A [Candidatus Goldbacteria bacterium]|nr:phosphatidylglycerophosphatase A [Candidatus Goldiibacteriota bacterium]
MKNLIIIISTFFYTGYFPFAPGTFATLCFLPIYYFLVKGLNPVLYLMLTVILYFVGVWSSSYASVIFNKKDPSRVVIDEIVGFLITMLFIPFTLKRMIVGFFIARILDIIKPYPARKLEILRAGNGIMIDDAVSGIYGNILLWLLIFFKVI